MKWQKATATDNLPPDNKNVFIKAHYKNGDCIIGIGFYQPYQPPHWESGVKIYGSTGEDPIYIEWLYESSPQNQLEWVDVKDRLPEDK